MQIFTIAGELALISFCQQVTSQLTQHYLPSKAQGYCQKQREEEIFSDSLVCNLWRVLVLLKKKGNLYDNDKTYGHGQNFDGIVRIDSYESVQKRGMKSPSWLMDLFAARST